jgi:hypothetical protein
MVLKRWMNMTLNKTFDSWLAYLDAKKQGLLEDQDIVEPQSIQASAEPPQTALDAPSNNGDGASGDNKLALCQWGCGRPAFVGYNTCCLRCTGPDGEHNNDCGTKAALVISALPEVGAISAVPVVGAAAVDSNGSNSSDGIGPPPPQTAGVYSDKQEVQDIVATDVEVRAALLRCRGQSDKAKAVTSALTDLTRAMRQLKSTDPKKKAKRVNMEILSKNKDELLRIVDSNMNLDDTSFF